MDGKKRRAKGEGTIYQRKNGTYAAKYNGKYAYARTRTEAADKLHDLIAANKLPTAQDVTIQDAMKAWLRQKYLVLKPTSYDRLTCTVDKHIIPSVGALLCSCLTEDVFLKQILQPMKASGLSFSSIKKAQDAFCAFCRWAASPSRRYMTEDPMASFERISKNSVGTANRDIEEAGIMYFDTEQREKFITACRSTWSNGNTRYPHGEALIFDMYSGLRMGELLALKWDNIDFKKKCVRVDAGVSAITDYNPDSPTYKKQLIIYSPYTKTNRPRLIPLGKPAMEALERIKTQRIPQSDYVLTSKSGGIVRPSVLSKTMANVCNLAGLDLKDGTNVHALRHTFASMCFAAGMPVRVVSELLGHSSVQVTMDMFFHLQPYDQ